MLLPPHLKPWLQAVETQPETFLICGSSFKATSVDRAQSYAAASNGAPQAWVADSKTLDP